MIKITAVLPTIGRIEYLDLSIRSLLEQKTPFDEIIIFDNSINQNLKQISQYGTSNKLKFIQSGKQLDAINSWNTAVHYATHEYVTIIGDDDILFNSYCDNIHEIIKFNEVGILKAYSIDKHGNKQGDLAYPDTTILTDKEFRKLRFDNKLSLFVPGIVFKKKLFQKIGGFTNTQIDGLAYADELLLTQLSYMSKQITISKEVCWQYRIHSEQIGNVKDISTYIKRANIYLDLYQSSLAQLGATEDEIYADFSRQQYLDKVCRYGIKLYGSYCGRHASFFTLFKNLIHYFLFDARVSTRARLRITLLTIKSYFGSTKLGKFIKDI